MLGFYTTRVAGAKMLSFLSNLVADTDSKPCNCMTNKVITWNHLLATDVGLPKNYVINPADRTLDNYVQVYGLAPFNIHTMQLIADETSLLHAVPNFCGYYTTTINNAVGDFIRLDPLVLKQDTIQISTNDPALVGYHRGLTLTSSI